MFYKAKGITNLVIKKPSKQVRIVGNSRNKTR